MDYLLFIIFCLVLLSLVYIKGLIYRFVDNESIKLLLLSKGEEERFKKEKSYLSLACLFSVVMRKTGESEGKMRLVKEYFDAHYSNSFYLSYPNLFLIEKKKDSVMMKERTVKMLKSGKLKSYRVYCIDILRGDFCYEDKMELLTTIFSVVLIQGFSDTEVQLLRNIAHFLLIKKEDLLTLEEKHGVAKKEEKRNSQTDYLYNLYLHTLSQSYRTLELEPSATKEEVKRAYRRLAMKYHPDKQPEDATEEERARSASQFRLVNEAYNYLCKERGIG
ncbi:MAG: DnaJ domain-containing protein [Paludibacteraceae bacterium]|nr:DnaJ domain-containing protein [Prevotellaceae bacterium]